MGDGIDRIAASRAQADLYDRYNAARQRHDKQAGTTAYLILSVDPSMSREQIDALAGQVRDRMPGIEPVIVSGVVGVHVATVPSSAITKGDAK